MRTNKCAFLLSAVPSITASITSGIAAVTALCKVGAPWCPSQPPSLYHLQHQHHEWHLLCPPLPNPPTTDFSCLGRRALSTYPLPSITSGVPGEKGFQKIPPTPPPPYPKKDWACAAKPLAAAAPAPAGSAVVPVGVPAPRPPFSPSQEQLEQQDSQLRVSCPPPATN